LPHLVLSNLHMKTCSLHYMSMSGMSAIVLACQLAHMAWAVLRTPPSRYYTTFLMKFVF
jgi:hypothetical protein